MVAYLGEDFLDTEWGLGSDIIFDIRFHRSGKFTELLHVLNRDRLHFHLYFLILCFRGFLTLITRARHQQGQCSYRYYFQHLTCLHIVERLVEVQPSLRQGKFGIVHLQPCTGSGVIPFLRDHISPFRLLDSLLGGVELLDTGIHIIYVLFNGQL